MILMKVFKFVDTDDSFVISINYHRYVSTNFEISRSSHTIYIKKILTLKTFFNLSFRLEEMCSVCISIYDIYFLLVKYSFEQKCGRVGIHIFITYIFLRRGRRFHGRGPRLPSFPRGSHSRNPRPLLRLRRRLRPIHPPPRVCIRHFRGGGSITLLINVCIESLELLIDSIKTCLHAIMFVLIVEIIELLFVIYCYQARTGIYTSY
jgi:hypothetical protein